MHDLNGTVYKCVFSGLSSRLVSFFFCYLLTVAMAAPASAIHFPVFPFVTILLKPFPIPVVTILLKPPQSLKKIHSRKIGPRHPARQSMRSLKGVGVGEEVMPSFGR